MDANFSTPIWTASDELFPALSNAEQVTLSEFGHTADVWSLQPEAIRHLLTTFYETGMVDDSLFTYQATNFNVGMKSFPFLAKVLMIAAGTIPLLTAGWGWLIFRRSKRRRAQAPQHSS